MATDVSTPCLTFDQHDEWILATQPKRIPVDFITNEVDRLFRLVNFVILSTLTALFGIVANGINMTVFYKQGFSTTTNISFFALAVSDTLCLVTSQCLAIFFVPYMETADINFVPGEVQHMTGGWSHVCSGRITSWITVFITAERCLGVALPLKVKQIITPRRTTVAMFLIFAVHFCMLLPEYAIAYFAWKFVPAKNRTLIGLVYRSYKDEAFGLSFTLTSASGMMSFVCVTFFTTFLVTKLAQKSKWRKQATGGSDSADTISTRDKKMMKMIIMIASVLIVCYIPGTTISLVPTFVPEFMVGHALNNSYFSFWSIAFVFDNINSSLNIFLYYRMSTKYRRTFNELFPICMTPTQPLQPSVQ